MKKQKYAMTALACVLALGLAIGACSQQQPTAGKPPAAAATTEKPEATAKPTQKLTLYTPDTKNPLLLQAQKVEVAASPEELPLATVKELVEGKTGQALQKAGYLPQGLQVLGCKLQDKVATVNLNKAFLTKGLGENVEMLMVYSIVNSLTANPAVEKVLFQVEGQKLEALGQLDLTTPLAPDKNLLAK